MTLLQLQYFQVLSHNLHYTRTAEQLCISQPSLSYAINELEKELGVKLFQKENRKVTQTVYGQQFLPYVEQALTLLQDGSNVLRQMANNAPQIVRLGYFHSVSASMIPALVDGFYQQEENRQIRFHFTESASYDILNQIRSGALDLGFSLHQAEWAESVGVIRQPLYLAVPATILFPATVLFPLMILLTSRRLCWNTAATCGPIWIRSFLSMGSFLILCLKCGSAMPRCSMSGWGLACPYCRRYRPWIRIRSISFLFPIRRRSSCVPFTLPILRSIPSLLPPRRCAIISFKIARSTLDILTPMPPAGRFFRRVTERWHSLSPSEEKEDFRQCCRKSSFCIKVY